MPKEEKMRSKILLGFAVPMALLAVAISGAQPSDEHMGTSPVRQLGPFLCGDVTGNGIIDSADIVRLIGYLFLNESPPDPLESADTNGDTKVDLADLVALMRRIDLGDTVYCDGSRPCDDRGERDSLSIQEIWGSAGDTVDVPIFVFNDDSIFFILCLSIPDPAKAAFVDTIITEFTRLAEMEIQGISHDTTGIHMFWYPWGPSPHVWAEYLPPGSGIVAYLRCLLKQDIPLDSPLCLDTTWFAPQHTTGFYTTDTYCITPEFNCVCARGDVTDDGAIDAADLLYLTNYLFLGTSAPDPLYKGDVNCDGAVDTADVIYLINYLFLGGSPPCGRL
jgi:hypothetical protein